MRIFQMQQGLLLLAVVTLLGSLTVVAGDAFLVATPRAAFAPRASVVPLSSQAWGLSLRGGATLVTEEDSDEEEESENEEEEEEEEEDEFDASLAAAAVKSTQKAKKKTQSAVKETVSAKLAKPKKKESLLKLLRVPYIIRAFLNPVTILSMTKHYWLSLINLEYPPRDQSQDLRSALDDKARKGGASTHARGKRKMKRGQAKTLSDLPKLNT